MQHQNVAFGEIPLRGQRLSVEHCYALKRIDVFLIEFLISNRFGQSGKVLQVGNAGLLK